MSRAIPLNSGRRNRSAASPPPRFILLNGRKRWVELLGADRTLVCPNNAGILEALKSATPDSIWISSRRDRTEALIKAIGNYAVSPRETKKSLGNLITIGSPRAETLPLLESWFSAVAGEVPSFVLLPVDQLMEVLSADEDDSRDALIGGIADTQTSTLTLVRGNFQVVTLPLSFFRPSGISSPDFGCFGLDDCGRTLQFGDYEATADVVLWETDPDYRRRMKARERAQAAGFGASLRRLRIQRGLTQADFPGVSRRTIARIESGEVEKPHGATLKRIAKALKVEPELIETY